MIIITNSLCALLSLIVILLALKTYTILKSKAMLLIVIQYACDAIIRVLMVLCELKFITIDKDIISMFILLTYIFFVIIMFYLLKEAKALFNKNGYF